MTTSSPSLRDQALALAGVAQFALYAHELAASGRDLPARMDHARDAIVCTDPDSAMDVFGEPAHVADGKRYLRNQLTRSQADAQTAKVAHYMGQALKLSGNLMKNEQALARIRAAIDRARLADSADVPEIIDAAYRENISPLKPRIMLHGHPSYLENPAIQARARTQLMAAIRCGVLWRQCRGSFVSLFLRRKALLAALDSV